MDLISSSGYDILHFSFKINGHEIMSWINMSVCILALVFLSYELARFAKWNYFLIHEAFSEKEELKIVDLDWEEDIIESERTPEEVELELDLCEDEDSNSEESKGVKSDDGDDSQQLANLSDTDSEDYESWSSDESSNDVNDMEPVIIDSSKNAGL